MSAGGAMRVAFSKDSLYEEHWEDPVAALCSTNAVLDTLR